MSVFVFLNVSSFSIAFYQICCAHTSLVLVRKQSDGWCWWWFSWRICSLSFPSRFRSSILLLLLLFLVIFRKMEMVFEFGISFQVFEFHLLFLLLLFVSSDVDGRMFWICPTPWSRSPACRWGLKENHKQMLETLFEWIQGSTGGGGGGLGIGSLSTLWGHRDDEEQEIQDGKHLALFAHLRRY